MTALAARNTRIGWIAGLTALVMVSLAYASAPLYRLFCQVTGYEGTPQRAAAAPARAAAQMITVRFDANTDPSIPWLFKPEQQTVRLHIGEQALAYYRATNLAHQAVTGRAVFNVTPDIMGQYFTKLECFCFTEQTLAPGQTVDMPVSYFIDPAILKDPIASKIGEITLSYTFFRANGSETGKEARAGAVATGAGVN